MRPRDFLFLTLPLTLAWASCADTTSALDGLLVINELQANNVSTIQDDAGGFADWVELYNAGEGPIDLSGFGLTDRVATPDKFVFEAGTELAAGDYLLVWMDNDPEEGPLHAAFGLALTGEELILYDADAVEIDAVNYGPNPADESYGRTPDAGSDWEWFTAPTPGEANP